MAVLVFALAGCGSSGSSDSAWWGGGDSGGGGTPVTTPQVQTLTNLNNPGQPIRQGDWTQINGAGFGATQGAGYVKYTLENGTTGNADQYSAWSDTQITCRVPVAIPMDIAVKGTWGAQVFTDNGGSSNELPTAGNPTPNPTPTNSPPPTASPSPTPSVSPSASPTPSVSPTPSPSPTSGGGGGGGGGPTPTPTPQWRDLGFAETQSDTNNVTNIQVGADSEGNVYVSYEYGDDTYVFEGDVGAKSFRNQNITFSPVATYSGYKSHSLFVPSDESKTFGIAYRNSTSLVIQKAVKSSGTWNYGNFTTVGTPPGSFSSSKPSLYLSGGTAYTSYGYYDSGYKVGVTNCTIPAAGVQQYCNWSAAPSMPGFSGITPAILSVTNQSPTVGYLNASDYNTYQVGSYQSSTGNWQNYSGGVSGCSGYYQKGTMHGTTPYVLTYGNGSGSWVLNLWGYDNTQGFIPVGYPALDTNVYVFGQPIVTDGKKTVAYSSGNTLYVQQNSNSSGPWTSIGTFTTLQYRDIGAGKTPSGAPLISYLENNSSTGTYGIRTRAYTTTTPKAIAQREFIRATFLCCYAGVTLPLPRL